MPLEEFGTISVAAGVATFAFALVDLGQSQTGAVDVARRLSKGGGIGRSLRFLLGSSMAFKLWTIVLTAGVLQVVAVLFGQRLPAFIDSGVLSLQWLAMIASVVLPPWLAIGIGSDRMFLISSIAPRACSLLATVAYAAMAQQSSAIALSAVHLLATTTAAFLGFQAYVLREGLVTVGDVLRPRRRHLVSVARRGLRAATVALSSLSYSSALLVYVESKQGPAIAGAFAMAERLVRTLTDLVVLSYQLVAARSRAKHDSDYTRRTGRRALIYGLVASAAVSLLCVAVGHTALAAILGEQKAKDIFPALAVQVAILPVVAMSGWLLMFAYILQQKMQAALPAFLTGGTCGLLLYALLPSHIIYAASIAAVTAETIVLAILFAGRRNQR